jgi:hypothetical protein
MRKVRRIHRTGVVVYRESVRQLCLVSRSFPKVSRTRGFLRTAHLALRELLFDLLNGTETSIDLISDAAPYKPRHPAHAGSNPVLFAELICRVSLEKKTSMFLDWRGQRSSTPHGRAARV